MPEPIPTDPLLEALEKIKLSGRSQPQPVAARRPGAPTLEQAATARPQSPVSSALPCGQVDIERLVDLEPEAFSRDREANHLNRCRGCREEYWRQKQEK